MPRGDGTGPMGYGPRTGRGAGKCAAGFREQGFVNRFCGGFGAGGRRNRSWRRDNNAGQNKGIYGELKNIKDQLNSIGKMINDKFS